METEKLEEITGLIEKCEIRVPDGISGQVVYNKESSRRGGGMEWILEPGAEVREGQVLVRLPNPDKMEVKALVQEQSITSVDIGMPAEIRVNALNNQVIKGIVTKVNQYAEQGGWMSSSVRKYAVLVRVINPPTGLITGMKTSVSIQTRSEQDQVQIPVQGVYGVQDRYFCLVKKADNQFESREVEIDGDNSISVVISKGLEPGEEVVMNPGEYKEMLELPEAILDRPIEMSDEEQALAKEQLDASKKQPSAGGGSPADEMFSKYDSNSDGSIGETEIAAIEEPMRAMVTRADRDKDGSVSKEELTTAFAEFQRRMQGGGGRPGGGGGPPGAGGGRPGGGRPGGGPPAGATGGGAPTGNRPTTNP